MLIVNTETLEVVTRSQLQAAHPNASFPLTLTEGSLNGTGFKLVQPSPTPSVGQYEKLSDPIVTEEDGEITVTYTVVDDLPSLPNLLKTFESAIDNLLSAKALEYNYDNVYTMISYRGDPNPKFAQEAESMFQWRSAVWTHINTLLTNYLTTISQGGLVKESIPSIGSIISTLPEFELV